MFFRYAIKVIAKTINIALLLFFGVGWCIFVLIESQNTIHMERNIAFKLLLMSGSEIYVTDQLKGHHIPPNVVAVDWELKPHIRHQIERLDMVPIDQHTYIHPPPHLAGLIAEISTRAKQTEVFDVVIRQRAFNMVGADIYKIKLTDAKRGILMPGKSDVLNFCIGLGIDQSTINFK